MKFRIYQPYFLKSQIPGLDPEFEHVNHLDNTNSELREHPINLKCHALAHAADLDVWGMFSWKWRQKMPNLTAQSIINLISANPDYDVYFFNPFSELESHSYNVWEQGQWHHPYLIEICQELFPMIGLDPNLLFQPMSYEVMCWANYYLGNKEFWAGWFDLIDRYQQAIPQLSQHTSALHNSSATYANDLSLTYFPFIHERLFSTYCSANKHKFRIKPFHYEADKLSDYSASLSNLKYEALIHNSQPILTAWDHLRGPGSKLATNWIKQYE